MGKFVRKNNCAAHSGAARTECAGITDCRSARSARPGAVRPGAARSARNVLSLALVLALAAALALTLSSCGGHWGGGTYDKSKGEIFTFETETIDGEPFTSEDIKDAKLVMINLWEPWCEPCVSEMPGLEDLYEELKDEGFVILGVFSETGMDEDAYKIIEEAGITYPILRLSEDFIPLQSDYVPTSVFITGEGELLLEDPIIGAQARSTWGSCVKGLMKGLDEEDE